MVSVIVPNYNHEAYLSQRLDSILNQSYQNFEVIILDDCSTDNSRNVIEQYRTNSKVSHIVYNTVNSGTTFKQWEKGINLSKGTYIWIAESDDWCEPTLLENLVAAIENTPNCTLAYCQSLMINEDERIIYHSYHSKLVEAIDGKQFVSNYMIERNAVFNASMAVFKKSCFYQISSEYLNYKFCGDWLFWAEIATQGNVCILAKVLNYFRKHGKDVSGKAFATGLNFLEEIKVLQHFEQRGFIDAAQFKKGLRLKYIKYRVHRINFLSNRRKEIEQLFFRYKSKNYQWFLLRNYYSTKIKNIYNKYISLK